MLIVATADLHGHKPSPSEFAGADLVIIAGDVLAHQDQAWDLETQFTPWLEAIPAPVVWIAGNHDFAIERGYFSHPDYYLLDETIHIQGLNVHGTPWVPNLPTWAFHARPGHDYKIPENLDILVTHGPPRTDSFVDRVDLENVGSWELAKQIYWLRQKPKLIICGHIHEGFGLSSLDWVSAQTGKTESIPVYNVSYVDEFYRATHKLVEIDV